MRIPSVMVLAALIAVSASRSDAQATGRLLGAKYGDLNRDRGENVADDGVRTSFARLLLDPSSRSPVRASSFAGTLFAGPSGTEAKLQYNLSSVKWGPDRAMALSLIVPTQKDSAYTNLVSLDGLSGKWRVELTYVDKLKADTGWRFTPNVSTKLSRPSFSFRTLPAAPVESERHFVAEATIGMSAIRNGYQLLRLGFGAGRSFQDSATATICQPATGAASTVLFCSAQTLGAPVKREYMRAQLEGRTILAGPAAIGVVGVFDFQSKAHAIDVPIWFVLAETSKDERADRTKTPPSLGGGIRISYLSTGTPKWGLAIFTSLFVI